MTADKGGIGISCSAGPKVQYVRRLGWVTLGSTMIIVPLDRGSAGPVGYTC